MRTELKSRCKPCSLFGMQGDVISSRLAQASWRVCIRVSDKRLNRVNLERFFWVPGKMCACGDAAVAPSFAADLFCGLEQVTADLWFPCTRCSFGGASPLGRREDSPLACVYTVSASAGPPSTLRAFGGAVRGVTVKRFTVPLLAPLQLRCHMHTRQ